MKMKFLTTLFLASVFSTFCFKGYAQSWNTINGYISLGTAYQIVTSTAINFTSSTLVSSSLISGTEPGVVCLKCTVDCHVDIQQSVTPQATISTSLLGAYQRECYAYKSRSNLSVIGDTATGKLFIQKMGR